MEFVPRYAVYAHVMTTVCFQAAAAIGLGALVHGALLSPYDKEMAGEGVQSKGAATGLKAEEGFFIVVGATTAAGCCGSLFVLILRPDVR